MCPMGVSPLRGLMKRAPCPAPALIVLYQTAWMGCLILGCIAAPPPGRSLNSVSATRPQVAAASYAHPEQHHLRVTRHRSSPPVSIYRSPASLKGGHGECGVQPPPPVTNNPSVCASTCCFLSNRERDACMHLLVLSLPFQLVFDRCLSLYCV